MAELLPKKDPSASALKIFFVTQRIGLFGICFIIDQAPWAAVERCLRSARL
jgi:hypothetical protein